MRILAPGVPVARQGSPFLVSAYGLGFSLVLAAGSFIHKIVMAANFFVNQVIEETLNPKPQTLAHLREKITGEGEREDTAK